MLPLPGVAESPQMRDIRLWQAWKAARGFAKEQALKQLLDALAGPIGIAINSYRAAPLPGAALELKAKTAALEACENYNPNAGSVTLANYVTTVVKQKLFRYVGTYQNVARLPEHQILQIAPLREAQADLSERFGRDPSAAEIADHLGLPLKHVERLQRGLRKDLLEEGGGGVEDIGIVEHDPNYERAMLAYYSLTELEKQVFDFSLGAHGQPKIAPGEMAKRLRVSNARVSGLKQQVAAKLEPYLSKAG